LFLESIEGVGTTVTIVLPTVKEETPETEKILPPTTEEEIKENTNE
jgi:hypothetical protein